MVPDVLGGVEHTECQTSQEVSGRQETSYGAQLETCHTCERQKILLYAYSSSSYSLENQTQFEAEESRLQNIHSSPQEVERHGYAHSRRGSCRDGSAC